MKVSFVHTPMSTVAVPERQVFWQNFDIQYHSAHPGLRHMNHVLWELPHWMHWLGGVLWSKGYQNLDVIDFYSDERVIKPGGEMDLAVVAEEVARHPSDVYLFSPMTVNLPMALSIADIIHATFEEARTVFGGVAATPLSLEIARHPSVDYVVTDRGEVALPDLLGVIEGRGSLQDVGNLVWSTERDPTPNVSTHHYQALLPADIAFPKVDLFPQSAGRDIRYIRQVYALGCPYKCSFCTIQTIGAKPQYFPIDRVLAEIRAYRARYGEHHGIYWGDETFTLHPERTLELLAALEEEGDISFDCQTRLNCLQRDDVLDALRGAGCRWIEIGLETGIQASHDAHKHRMKLKTTEETLERVRDSGLAACSFMVNGFPEQSPDDMRRSVEWVCDLISRDLLQASYLFGLVPYPGSTMYEAPERFGMRILHKDFGRYHEDLPPVFETENAKPDEAYAAFLDGVEMLGQAMGKRPYFGKAPSSSEREEFGRFWAAAHV